MKNVIYGLCLTLTLSFGSQALANKPVGTLMVVKGDVIIKSEGKKDQKARLGMRVHAKDTIVTQKEARVKVVMIDKNEINISPESEMNFEKYVFEPQKGEKDVMLNVIYGKVRSNVQQKYDGEKNRFQVKTKAAVAGVRGTDFLSGYNASSGKAQFVTFTGVVEVGQAGAGGRILNAVRVTPGQMTTAGIGQPPSRPQSVPKNQLADMDMETGAPERMPTNDGGGDQPKVEDNGGNDGASDQQKSEPGGGQSSNNEPASGGGDDGGQKSGNTADSGGSGSGDRTPASSGSAGDMLAGDVVGGESNNAPVSTASPNPPSGPPPPPPPPRIPELPKIPVCETCKQFIEGGKSKLIITIKQ